MPPREWPDDLAELNRRMSLDSGRRRALSVARESGTGRLVGFTEASVWAGSPDLAYQGSTLVMREHRGHRLGLRLEAAYALLVMDALPDVRRIRTWNASMRAVNRLLGHVMDASHRMWQKQV